MSFNIVKIVELFFKDSSGNVGNQLLFRNDESDIELVEDGVRFGFDKDGDECSDEKITELLCTIKGIGKWMAEMFLIFHLARPNVLPLTDTGLVRAIEKNYNDGNGMSKEQFNGLGPKWSPWCTVTTWYLWRSLDPIPVEY